MKLPVVVASVGDAQVGRKADSRPSVNSDAAEIFFEKNGPPQTPEHPFCYISVPGFLRDAFGEPPANLVCSVWIPRSSLRTSVPNAWSADQRCPCPRAIVARARQQDRGSRVWDCDDVVGEMCSV
ncbi:uncharacterized protein J3R85_016615 [Psidium guajava]|nr:uncharacterized protein J3R85_016615 [Psidium guajava]